MWAKNVIFYDVILAYEWFISFTYALQNARLIFLSMTNIQNPKSMAFKLICNVWNSFSANTF